MSFGIDGIVSGLDTTALINALVAAEGGTQRQLVAKRTSAESLITAWQSLNTKVAALATKAGTLTGAALQPRTATSTSTAVTATAQAGATTGEISLVVTRLAQTQSSVTAAMTAWPTDPPVLTVRSVDGTLTEITAATTSLDDVVRALGSADAGVRASKVATGTDPVTGQPTYRLQLTATASGAAGAFEVFAGTAAEVGAGTAPDLFAAPGAAHVRAAQDAVVTLWAGTAAEQEVTSATNTFADLLAGVDVTVGAVTSEPVTVAVGADAEALETTAADLVESLAAIFAEIAARSRLSTTTAADGTTVVTGGLFAGDSAARDTAARLLGAATDPVDGRSPSEIGIEITRDGTVEFDAARFREALATDPARVDATLAAVAARVAAAGEAVSDPRDGTLSKRISGHQEQVKDIGTQIADWDRRLAAKRDTLQRQFTAMEVALSRLQAQQSYLTSQLAALAAQTSTR